MQHLMSVSYQEDMSLGGSKGRQKGERGTSFMENLKTIIKMSKGQPAFYYHHVLEILNDVSNKISLPSIRNALLFSPP